MRQVIKKVAIRFTNQDILLIQNTSKIWISKNFVGIRQDPNVPARIWNKHQIQEFLVRE